MLNYKFTNNILEIKGHSLFGNYGNDIVCSAVSTAVIVSINLIEKFNKLDKILYKLESGYLYLEIKDQEDLVIKNIIDNLLYTLKDISTSYPKNIKEDN